MQRTAGSNELIAVFIDLSQCVSDQQCCPLGNAEVQFLIVFELRTNVADVDSWLEPFRLNHRCRTYRGTNQYVRSLDHFPR